MTLTDDITEDLARRLRTGGAAPEPLTLAALAKAYGVSSTPVRQAVAELIERGLVERLPNGRLQVGRRRARGRATRAAIPSLARGDGELIAAVEREVLRRSLRGQHAFLREEAFAERMGVGRSRLRRVLHSLAGAGVVEHVARCGWRARPFERDDMLAFLDVRATLEMQALDQGRSRFDDDELLRFAQGNDAAAVAAGAIDNALHAYFVEQAGNHYLAAFFASHGRYYARLFDFAAVDSGRLAEMAGQHCEILEHCRQRRWARARASLRHHIHSQAPVLGAAIDRLRSDSNSTDHD